MKIQYLFDVNENCN